jgi:hypothetical protein
VGTVEYRGVHIGFRVHLTLIAGGGDTSHSLGVLLRLPLGHV